MSGSFCLCSGQKRGVPLPVQPTSLLLISVVQVPKILRQSTLQDLRENHKNSYQWRKAEVQSGQSKLWVVFFFFKCTPFD